MPRFSLDEIMIAISQASGILWRAEGDKLPDEAYLKDLSVKIGAALPYLSKAKSDLKTDQKLSI